MRQALLPTGSATNSLMFRAVVSPDGICGAPSSRYWMPAKHRACVARSLWSDQTATGERNRGPQTAPTLRVRLRGPRRLLRQAKRLAALPAFPHRNEEKSLSSNRFFLDNTIRKPREKGGKGLSTTRKRWISAEVDGRLVAQLQREAEARGISRSEAVRRALLAWTREAMEGGRGENHQTREQSPSGNEPAGFRRGHDS